ncbi:MAG: hypothetical protein ACRC62_31900 [Microcoleus sp.]
MANLPIQAFDPTATSLRYNCQLSTINCQLSTVNSQLSTKRAGTGAAPLPLDSQLSTIYDLLLNCGIL